MKTIIARFMHQHKDKAVYERIILERPCFIAQRSSKSKYMMFTMPLYWFNKYGLSLKWDESCRAINTCRSVQFVDADNTNLLTLPTREIAVAILRFPISDPIAILCGVMVDEHETFELEEIFQKYFTV